MKKSKRLLSLFLSGTMLLSSVPVAIVAGAEGPSAIKVAAISDIRYQADAPDEDGLMLSRSAALLDAAIDKVTKSDADVLLVTGDLTNDGSQASHQYVIGKLREVEAKGIDVYVIPGEHDVRESGVNTSAVSKGVFENLYKDFGYGESIQDSASASYVADLGNGFKVVMSDSVAANGEGQLPQWAVEQAKSIAGEGDTVFAASHYPAVSRSSVDKTFIDLLHTLSNLTIELGGTFKLYTEDPDTAAASLGLRDNTRIMEKNGASPAALADSGVKFLFTGHSGALTISQLTTTSGAQLYDVMSGSLVNSSASVRYATLSKGTDGMKQQRAEFATEMITSASGVEDVQSAAHAALKGAMPAMVDDAIAKVKKVIAHLLPAIEPNVKNLITNIDLGALGVQLPDILNPIISQVKGDLNNKYVDPLFDALNADQIAKVIDDLRTALEALDYNGQDLYGLLADIFGTIARGDGKTPDSLQGIFDAIIHNDPELLTGLINSFADSFAPDNLVNLVNKVLSLKFSGTYLGLVTINIQLRGMLAGPYSVVSGLMTVDLNLWDILDGAVTLPTGKKLSELVRPLVNDLVLGGENDAVTEQTPTRFTENLRKNAPAIVSLLNELGVGDLLGGNLFIQGQSGAFVARSVSLDEVESALNKTVPNDEVVKLNPADWAAIRDAVNAAGRFTAEELAKINKVIVEGTEDTPAKTQLDKLKELMDDTFYQGVADNFTAQVNKLPETEELTLEDAQTVYTLQSEYDQFFAEIKAKIQPETIEKLNAAVAKIRALELADPEVDAVIAKIEAIGVVTEESEARITEARAAYDKLSAEQKSKVTNYDVLVAAEKALAQIKENAAKIQEVEEKITAIGEVSFTTECKQKIDAARSAYDALDPDLKASVSNYNVLTAAEERYAELAGQAGDAEAARVVRELIAAIGEVTLESKDAIEAAEKAYEELTPAQKKLVDNYEVLTAARAAYDKLVQEDEANKQAAQAVMEKIAAIGDVTLESEAKITEAREAYEKLTAEQKKLVTNLDVLTQAEKKLKELKEQAADAAAAQKVDDMIAAIGAVTIDKEDEIGAARAAYNKLTPEQKRLVKNLSTLVAAEAALSALKKDIALEDGATGITLRADRGVLPPETRMNVKPIVDGSIYDQIMGKGYKAIRLYEISLLNGEDEAVPQGSVRISIPQFAVNTAVYAVDPSGEMTALEATLENGLFTFSTEKVGMFAVVQSVVYADTAALEEQIRAFEGLESSLYTPESYAKAQEAYGKAQEVLSQKLEQSAINQRKIEVAASGLKDAIAALRFKKADISALTSALYQAKLLNGEDYENFDAVESAVAAAEKFLAGTWDIRDQEKIAALTKAITDAVSALTYAAPDFSSIDTAIEEVPSDLDTANYTPDSVAAVKAAVQAAEELKETLTREDPEWEAKVAAASEAIMEAIDGLKMKDVSYADTSLLETALSMVDLYNPSDYSNFSAVTAAVEAAKELLAQKPTAEQQEAVDDAAMAILNAISALEWA